jgi:ABC-type nickel/cobalt efflux system permease component RcnA
MEGGSYVLLIILALVLAVRALVEVVRVPGGKKKAAASLGAVLVSGIYPCPGAVLVLVLALTLDMLFVGVLAVFAMSLGMSIPIIAAGYLAWFGRTGIFLGLWAREDRIARLSAGVEFAGYLLLLGFSLYMAQPFLVSLLRMIPVR